MCSKEIVNTYIFAGGVEVKCAGGFLMENALHITRREICDASTPPAIRNY